MKDFKKLMTNENSITIEEHSRVKRFYVNTDSYVNELGKLVTKSINYIDNKFLIKVENDRNIILAFGGAL